MVPGRFFRDRLEDNDLVGHDENTRVVMISDHSEMFGPHSALLDWNRRTGEPFAQLI